MTRPRYKTEIKLFAINQHAAGKGWPVIQKEIKEKFDGAKPTVRAMEKWEKSIDRESIKAELMKDVKGHLPTMQSDAQIAVMSGLIPVLFSAKDAGQDMETTAWKWFFQWIEKYLGRERFEQLIDEYFKETEANAGAPKEKEA